MARTALRVFSLICFGLGLAGAAEANPGPVTIVGRIEGVINPITTRYVDRLISDGESRGASAVVFTIDTPGGTLDATSQITQRMLNAKVPVLTFVSPPGARAASAGTFITLAGHVAAMAPSTNIGAAHPVDSSGGDIQGDLRLKAENDAVAQIRNIASARGHNADWAEQAVRKSVSIGTDEAIRLNVVDLVATDVADLLRKADGREVTLAQGTVRLATAATTQVEDPFTPFERLLHFVTNPQVAILLFTIGTYGLIFELSNPSLIFPGVVGVIAILLALFAFGTLDANGAGIALLLFAVLLFLSELWVPSHGILTAGGVAAIVVGAIVLFPPGRPTLPGLELQVPPVTIAAVAGASAVFFVIIARGSLHYRRLSAVSTSPTLVGSLGIAKSDVDRSGIVHVAGEDWSAISAEGPIHRGEEVRVNAVDGLRLLVSPAKGKEGV